MIIRAYTFIILAISLGFCSGSAFCKVSEYTALNVEKAAAVPDVSIGKDKIEKAVDFFSCEFAVLDSFSSPQLRHLLASYVFIKKVKPKTPFLLHSSGLSPPFFS